MNRRKIGVLAVVLALIAGGIYWQRSRTHTDHAQTEAEQSALYHCPMHPTVTSDKPGNCPICGMKFVKRAGSQSTDAATQIASSAKLQQGEAAVTLTPSQRVLANVKTVQVAMTAGTAEVVTTGRVTFDERRLAQVTSYTAGRIEQLSVNFTGDSVVRGRAVATIYSPDLYATQQEYLLALANRERMSKAGFPQARSAAADLVDSTRRRLQLFGMTGAQIDRLASGGKPFSTTSIISPVSGIVTQKLVVPQQYVAQGQALFEVADLSMVWVEADVYEQDLATIAIGQRVSVTAPSMPGATFSGTVAFVQPTVAGESRTTSVRIELPNRNLQLKPGMYVSVRFFGGTGPPAITVPATAIVDRGRQQFVWVEVSPGNFVSRQVTVGARTPERVVILSGLKAGEMVAVEGGFLLDSEAQLRGAGQG
ncbi:MAG: efflux RND transporter periplasmic adaptor subunit [Acidobacteriota bacterium]|nr:efflux RND transporter periplasmic adaptor subunit [Acidobacteriota bacterium]